MKCKTCLMGIIAISAVSAQILMPVVAHANTSVEYAPTTIIMDGASLTPQHVLANDPWSGKPTSWVPIYYLQQVLTIPGVHTTWNGNTLDVTPIPSGWKVNVSGAPQTGTPPTGQMQFSIGGNQDGFLRAPKLVVNDPANNAPTTYVPIYYVNLFLQQRLLMGASWKNTTWIMASPQDVNRMEVTATPSTVNVGQSVTISGELLLVDGVGSPYAQLSVVGIPNNKTISTDSQGKFTFSTTFDNSGEYTVTISDKYAEDQVNVTVK